MIESLSLILFGWLLGLLGPPIADLIKKRVLRSEIRNGIKSELAEVQYRLACSVYTVHLRYGELNKNLLAWVFPIMKNYRGSYASERLLRALESHLELSDEQLDSLGKIRKSDGTRTLSFRKYSTPFLDSHVGDIGLFSCELQVALFELRAQIGLLNDQIDDAKTFRAMTFEPDISSENYAAVCDDLEKNYKLIGDRSKTIADAINHIMNLKQ